MRNTLITLLVFLTNTLSAQISVFHETNFTGTNSLGVEYKNKKGYGLYASFGGNGLIRMIGANQHLDIVNSSDFNSTVSWYTQSGCYYRNLPNNPMFTTPEWGNKLLETGVVTNTVEIWNINKTVTKKIANIGVVIPVKNVKVRIGGGVYRKIEVGQTDYSYWSHKFKVSKYYDEWGVVAQPSGVFVVESSLSLVDRKEVTPINNDIIKANINMAVEFNVNEKTNFTVGFDGNGGINFGFGYNLN